MLIIASETHRLHDPVEPHMFGGVPLPPRENAARIDAILDGLQAGGPVDRREPAAFDPTLAARIHTPRYLEFLETAHARWRSITGAGRPGEALPFVRPMLGAGFTVPDHVLAQMGRYSNDADPILAGTWEAASTAAAGAATGADAVLSGEVEAAYALVRPPGHHAGPDNFGGYCYLNNTAIAAELVAREGARAAVLDVDAHAGNGTQTVFWNRRDVLTVSLHVDPAVEYPYFQGHAHERGGGEGEGFNLNLPMDRGTEWARYEPVLQEACRQVVNFGPDVVVVALGVDTATQDGVLNLVGDDYRRIGACLAKVGLPVVMIQEGGYDLSVLGQNVASVIEGFEQTVQ